MNISKNISNKHLGLIMLAILFLLASAFIMRRTFSDFWIAGALAICLAIILALQLSTLNDIRWNINQSLTQHSLATHQYMEALFNIHSLVKLRHPLPLLDGWVMSPHSINELIAQIQDKKPSLIVELGSGVSTLIAGYCLQQLGSGRILSMDHDKNFCDITRANLAKHGLADVCKVIYAPLKTIAYDHREFMWYDLDVEEIRLELNEPISMLVIDGPPDNIQTLSRYPAVPMLIDRLSEDALIILDDYDRESEKKVVELWKKFDLQPESVAVAEQAISLKKIAGNTIA